MIEGDYVDRKLLQIEERQYMPWNLEERFQCGRKFDLAISLEVAEHLCAQRAASFCEDLTFLSNVILFSAAIPYQGGTGHINEQPLRYWVKLFAQYNYEGFDIVRPLIQYDKNIPFWYRQNIIVFVKKNTIQYNSIISKMRYLPPLNMVSYDSYIGIQKRIHSLWVYKIYSFVMDLYNAVRMHNKKT